MELTTSFMPRLAHLGNLATVIGGRIKLILKLVIDMVEAFIPHAWDRVRIVLRRIYIFFARPNVIVVHQDLPYYRKERSEAQKKIDLIMSKISKG